MNPWAILFVIVGVVFIVVGFHGSQHNFMAAFKGAV